MAQSRGPADTDVIDPLALRERVLAYKMLGQIMGVPPHKEALAADAHYLETGVPMDLNPSARRAIRDGMVAGRIT